MSGIFKSLFMIHYSKNSQRGLPANASHKRWQAGASTIYIVIIMILIIFAVMLSGGPSSLLSGDVPTSVTDTPVPTQQAVSLTPIASPSPAPTTSSPAVQWSITFTIESCNGGIAIGKITPTGPTNGYVTVERQDASGNFIVSVSDSFTAPENSLNLRLDTRGIYANQPWRLTLFEGGTGSKNNYSGGIQRATIQGTPTACP